MVANNSPLLLAWGSSTGRKPDNSKPIAGIHATYPPTAPARGCNLAQPSVYPITQPSNSLALILATIETANAAWADCFFFSGGGGG